MGDRRLSASRKRSGFFYLDLVLPGLAVGALVSVLCAVNKLLGLFPYGFRPLGEFQAASAFLTFCEIVVGGKEDPRTCLAHVSED